MIGLISAAVALAKGGKKVYSLLHDIPETERVVDAVEGKVVHKLQQHETLFHLAQKVVTEAEEAGEAFGGTTDQREEYAARKLLAAVKPLGEKIGVKLTDGTKGLEHCKEIVRGVKGLLENHEVDDKDKFEEAATKPLVEFRPKPPRK